MVSKLAWLVLEGLHRNSDLESARSTDKDTAELFLFEAKPGLEKAEILENGFSTGLCLLCLKCTACGMIF